MANHFTVDVLTPDKIIAKDIPAQSLMIPTIRGQINVLPDHTHIITRLSTGQLSIFGGVDDGDRHFSVTYGICKVLENKIIILSNTSEEQFEINKERAELAFKNASDYLKSNDSLTDIEIEKYRRKIERAELRIQLSQLKK